MKWFKHMTASADDEKLAALVGQGGVDGLALYGAYWRMAEIVAKQMEGKTPSCSVTYPVWRWTQLMFTRKSHLSSVLSQLKKVGLLSAEGDPKTDQHITVRMPNLLKYRDEYSKKSGHSPDIVQSYTEAEGEGEAETEETISVPTEPHPAEAGQVVSPEQEIYQLYPRKEGSAAALVAIEKAVKKLVKGKTKSGRPAMVRRDAQRLLYRAVRAYASSPIGQQADKTKLPHPATWFNQERWDDDQTNWQITPKTGGLSGKPEYAKNKAERTYDALEKVINRGNSSRVGEAGDFPAGPVIDARTGALCAGVGELGSSGPAGGSEVIREAQRGR